MKEIALLGERNFLMGVQILCINKNLFLTEDKLLPKELNNFHIFMTVMQDKETSGDAKQKI
jgi:hypothetical protein